MLRFMPTLDIAAYKPVADTDVDAVQIANGFEAIKAVVNALDSANWASGKIFAPSKLMQEAATDGQALLWNNGLSKWAPATIANIPGYGTSLPGSPTDGQQYVLVDSATNPTYAWLFRYNAGSANTDKWDCIAGVDAEAEVATPETTASAAYVDLATVGPSITIPRAGVYLINFSVECDKTASSSRTTSRVAAKLGAAAAADADSNQWGCENQLTYGGNLSHEIRRTLAASDVVKLQYKISADTGRFTRRTLSILPVRVS